LTTYDDKITSYSSKGPTLIDHIVKPDLVPPGNRMYSMEPNGGSMVQTYLNNRVAWSSYDSSKAASPSPDYFELQWHVHDSSASKWNRCSSDPAGFNVDARSSEGTATDPVTGIVYISENDVFTVGAGYLNVPAALNNSAKATLPATSPSGQFIFFTQTVSLVTRTGAIWVPALFGAML